MVGWKKENKGDARCLGERAPIKLHFTNNLTKKFYFKEKGRILRKIRTTEFVNRTLIRLGYGPSEVYGSVVFLILL